MPRVRSSFTVNTSGPLAVLLALFALASPSDAGEAGEERISFERREFTLKETATFAPAVERYIIRGVLEIANREKVTYGKARDLFGQKSILVGYGDINPGLFTNPLAVDFSACDASLVAGSFAAGESRVLPQLCDSHLRHERREEAAVEASGTATGDPAVA